MQCLTAEVGRIRQMDTEENLPWRYQEQGSYSNVTVVLPFPGQNYVFFHTFQGIVSEVTTLGHYITLV